MVYQPYEPDFKSITTFFVNMYNVNMVLSGFLNRLTGHYCLKTYI